MCIRDSSDTVGEFVHKDEVAFNQAGTHGAGRDLEWLGDKGTQDEDDEDDREKAAHVVGKVGFVLVRRVFFQTTFYGTAYGRITNPLRLPTVCRWRRRMPGRQPQSPLKKILTQT